MLSDLQTQMVDLGETLKTGFKDVIAALNDDINTGIKQDPDKVPLVTVNTNPANEQIQLIGTSLTQLKDFLAQEQNQITLVGSNTNPLAGQITSATQAPALVNENLTANHITLVASNTNPLAEQVTLVTQVPAQLNENLTANPITLVASTTNPLDAQVQLIGTSVSQAQDFLTNNTITLVGSNTNPLSAQITLVAGAPELVNQNLSQNTITLVASNENPLAGQINLVTQTPDQMNQNLQQNTITMVGAQTNPLEAQVQAAIASHQQLQQYMNQNPIIMQVQQPQMGGYGGGAYGGYGGGGYPQYAFAAGLKPTVLTSPTRLLVAEAGPEVVSVTPVKRNMRPRVLTAANGMGQQMQLWASDAEEEAYKREVVAAMEQGTQQGMDQAMPGMQQAVSQGAQQGVQEGMQQGGMGGGGQGAPQGYPMAPSNTEIFGAGRFHWGGGASGTQLGGPGMGGGGAQYPVAPSNTHLWGRPQRFTWTGGAMGTNYTPAGMGGGRGGSATYGPFPWPPTGGSGGDSKFGPGYRLPGFEQYKSDADYNKALLTYRDQTALERGTQKGTQTGLSRSMGGIEGSVYQGAREGVGEGMAASGGGMGGGAPAKPLNIGDPGYPGVYTGTVPASYGPPLGQLINGIAATILPGQGPRGARQAQFGMHEFLKKDTLIQAHKGERVDITPPDKQQIKSRANEYVERRLDAIMRLIAKLASQQNITNVSFEVEGRTLSRVAAKNMGVYGYGDH
jgi:hypothetical protein